VLQVKGERGKRGENVQCFVLESLPCKLRGAEKYILCQEKQKSYPPNKTEEKKKNTEAQ